LTTFNAKRHKLSSVSKFITLSVHVTYLQHVRRDAARRAGLSATADLVHRRMIQVSSPIGANYFTDADENDDDEIIYMRNRLNK